MENQIKNCQNCSNEFKIESEDFEFYEKIKVPPPTFCPDCRMQRRFNWRNERALYKRKCDLCAKDTITMFPAPYKIYCSGCWYSDNWDSSSYAKDYNWDETFFKQWNNLFSEIPLIALHKIGTNIKSDFVNYARENNNCYLTYSSINNENVMYSYGIDKSKDSLDSTNVKELELSYENFNSQNNYKGIFLINSRNCLNSAFLFDCVNCQFCFLSCNLRNKSYVFKNVQYTKDEYENKIKDIDFGSYFKLKSIIEEFYENAIIKSLHKFSNIIKSLNCSGDNIENSKDIKYSFNVYDSEQVRYSSRVVAGSKEVYDGYGIMGELFYEGLASGWNAYLTKFVFLNDKITDVSYSVNCYNSSNLFGCIGLRNKQYCILNKQYTKEEYEQLVPKIIEHMNSTPYVDKKGRIYKYGEFFPSELSPFSYNETIAQEYFPLTKELAEEQGYSWKEAETRSIQPTIKSEQLPDHIKDVDDTILKQVIECGHIKAPPAGGCNENCTTAFKIIPKELEFYRKMNLPLPRLCPNCRHYQRIKQRNPFKLWHRKCMCQGNPPAGGANSKDKNVYTNTITHTHGTEPCSNEFETTYSPDRPEIVYCEACYQAEVV